MYGVATLRPDLTAQVSYLYVINHCGNGWNYGTIDRGWIKRRMYLCITARSKTRRSDLLPGNV